MAALITLTLTAASAPPTNTVGLFTTPDPIPTTFLSSILSDLVTSATPSAGLIESATPSAGLVESATPSAGLVVSATPSSDLITSATPSSSMLSPGDDQPSLSTGAKAGIASAAAILAVVIIATLLLLYRRRRKKQNTVHPTVDEPYMKAELPGESKPYSELDQNTSFYEASGLGRPFEADHSSVRAELESDWTGWEASALLEVDLSREALDSQPGGTGQKNGQRDSIQQTPIDMVARR
jgi:LPXTG-motif cell wall-anchored protein